MSPNRLLVSSKLTDRPNKKSKNNSALFILKNNKLNIIKNSNSIQDIEKTSSLKNNMKHHSSVPNNYHSIFNLNHKKFQYFNNQNVDFIIDSNSTSQTIFGDKYI